MKTPKRIEPLIEDGLVDEVLRPLMSGKEAAVYVVRCGNELRCAKVYKEANKRSFRQASEYQEGRKVRNSRQARAMAKGSKFGKKKLKTPGKTPKSRHCSAWRVRAFACPSRTTSSKACC